MNRKTFSALPLLFTHNALFALFTLLALLTLFSLSASPLPALAESKASPQGNHPAPSLPAPQTGPDIQTYRIDRLEQSLDKLNLRLDALPDHMENRFRQDLTRQTEATARWVESAQESLSKAQSNFSNTLNSIAVAFALFGGGIIWFVKFKYKDLVRILEEKIKTIDELTDKIERDRERIENTRDEIDKSKQEVEGIAQKCKILYTNAQEYVKGIEEVAKKDPDKPRTPYDANTINTVADDQNAPLLSRLFAKAMLAKDDKNWAKAIDYWKAVIHEAPENPLAHFHLAYCAQHLAKMEPEQAHLHLATACRHYMNATNNDPELAIAFSNWGAALADLAKIAVSKEEKTRLLNQSCKKYEQASDIDPQYSTAFSNWGGALADLAKLAEATEDKTRLLNQACEKCKRATDINSQYSTAFSNWGAALADLAVIAVSKEEKTRLLNQSCEKYEQAIEIDPNHAASFSNWGNAIADLAKIAEATEDKARLLNQACEKHEHATGINPNLAEAFYNWGAVLIHLAQISGSPEGKTQLLSRAKEVCLKAHDIKPGKGTYNLACIAALEGDKEQCREWLETSLATGNMVSCDELTTDEDLKAVRNEPWFKDVLAKVCDR